MKVKDFLVKLLSIIKFQERMKDGNGIKVYCFGF
nr:MAG TPA: hypothetical protein [Caudoviricetes sp.]